MKLASVMVAQQALFAVSLLVVATLQAAFVSMLVILVLSYCHPFHPDALYTALLDACYRLRFYYSSVNDQLNKVIN